MRHSMFSPIALGALSLALALPTASAVDFAKEIAPILKTHCLDCHGPDKQKGKLRLDTKEALLKGGSSGPSVKGGHPDESELFKRVSLPRDDDERMPPEGEPLTAQQIAVLKQWIQDGAAWPDGFNFADAPKATPPPAAVASSAPAAPPRPPVPAPELPKEFQPAAGEAAAIAALAKNGVSVRPIAQNLPWHEVNLRPLASSVTDETIAPLKEVTSLVELRLGATKVTDSGLAVVASLPHLQVIGLELTGVTDAGIAHFAGLKNLTSVNLYGTAITDAALEHFTDKKHLRNLYLWQTKVTPEGVKKLQEALPGLDINTGVALAAVSTNAPAAK